jgi:hypothetical protein
VKKMGEGRKRRDMDRINRMNKIFVFSKHDLEKPKKLRRYANLNARRAEWG